MGAKDYLLLIHPALAVTLILPIVGIASYFAWQVRQRRLKTADGKSKIPPSVGVEHFRVGRVLANGVVGLALLGMGRPIFYKMITAQTFTEEPFRFWFVGLMFILTIASLVLLNQAKPKLWRGVFAILTGMGLVLIGSQPEVFRRGEILAAFQNPAIWKDIFTSHYYYGIMVALLMIFSLAIYPEIYRSKLWRNVHIILNCLALLLFIGQGITGTRDLLEIPLSWQEPHVYKCDFTNLTCPS
ncbi:MAG: DUF4079 domain-containing protein [Cyanobacteria bacterium CRU_2_1]|nr:DUF4079 domain-containing protein [Cyanobacteria bacterium RU_5_0]NJR60506.1 DUF4079 domain-containing protein [Cyanobacteria bacterium CRU_2_1]